MFVYHLSLLSPLDGHTHHRIKEKIDLEDIQHLLLIIYDCFEFIAQKSFSPPTKKIRFSGIDFEF